MEKNNIQLEVKLRPLALSDTDNIVKWRNSQFVKNNLFSQNDLTVEQHVNYFNNVVSKGKCYQFIIEAKIGMETLDIGTTFIKNIDFDNRKGEFGIFIGEEKARGKGCAKLAIKEILQIAFNELNLNRCYLEVLSNNQTAIKLYKKVGFQIEGTLHQDYIRNEETYDVILMAILKENYMK
ncbi:UDP-4-amino-4,6-dideoxy-N-acetyl-beta-L-altrosamine N-acetyltransferase [Treponema sp.]|uniref:UDP-4-amino-4, 6-dideoxy-N-acetyl-beta-L-altrosamine N-acetyltransferase n=1 Tax=Treponema sp. TaxID=166 RepID=UPI00388E88B5